MATGAGRIIWRIPRSMRRWPCYPRWMPPACPCDRWWLRRATRSTPTPAAPRRRPRWASCDTWRLTTCSGGSCSGCGCCPPERPSGTIPCFPPMPRSPPRGPSSKTAGLCRWRRSSGRCGTACGLPTRRCSAGRSSLPPRPSGCSTTPRASSTRCTAGSSPARWCPCSRPSWVSACSPSSCDSCPRSSPSSPIFAITPPPMPSRFPPWR